MADPTALVDPTDPYGQNKAKRQRQIADALRKQGEADVGGGEMVSGHYVAPAWTQQLAKLAGTVGGAYMGSQADAAEEASKGKIAEATSQWAGGAPQATAAVPGTADQIQGLGGREQLIPGTPGQAAQPVTGGQILKHSLAGMQIPGNEKAAQMYQTGAMADMSREDTQTFRNEQAQLAAKAKLESEQAQRQHDLKQLTMRLEDRGLDRGLQESLKQQQMALQAQIAQGNQALQAQGLDLRRQGLDIQRQGLELKQETAKTKADAKAKELGLSEAGVSDAIAALDKAKDKGTGYGAGIVQEYVPGGTSLVNQYRDKTTNDAIQKLTYWTDEIRHGRFGSALTNGEKASAAQYLPGPYDTLQQTKDKAKGLHAIIQLNGQRLKGSSPMPKELGGEGGTPTTASSGPVTQAPAAATKTIGGKTYVQQNGQWFEQ